MGNLVHCYTVNISRIALFIAGIATAIAGNAIAGYLSHPFEDIPQGAYFNDAVGKWWRRGVIKGYNDTTFGPDDPVTRGQMAVILDRFEANAIDPLRQEIMQINRVLKRPSDLSLKLPTEEDRPNISPDARVDRSDNAVCVEKRNELDILFNKYRSCQTDTDCALFIRPCGPYVTCGKAVTKNVLPTLERSVALLEDLCTDAFPVACATCIEMNASCTDGQCASITKGASLLEERCTTYLREADEETYCATCGNGICEPFERCTSSNCRNGSCTQDCGGLYCPGDCE